MTVHGFHQAALARQIRQQQIQRWQPPPKYRPRRKFWGYTAMGWLIIFNLVLMSALLGASAGAVMIVLEGK